MEIIIVLTPENTVKTQDVTANFTITVDLTRHWAALQKCNRFYVSSRVVVSVDVKETRKVVDLTVRDHFMCEDILHDGAMYYVVQKGYIEGVITELDNVKVQSNIWRYDLIERM